MLRGTGKGFADSTDRYVCLRLGKAASLLPAGPEQRRIADEMIQRAADMKSDRWFHLARALADYRAGRFDDAIHWCRQAEKVPFNNPAADASIQCLLALAHHSSGAALAARQALQKADEMVAGDFPTLESGRIGGVGIENWLICHTLLREAHRALP